MAERDAQAFIRVLASKDGAHYWDLGHSGVEGWSGCALRDDRGMRLFYSGKGNQQAIFAAQPMEGSRFQAEAQPVLNPRHPKTAWRARSLGYHLKDGDGLIMAFRDPHLRTTSEGYTMLFAAKALAPQPPPKNLWQRVGQWNRWMGRGPIVPAVGRATSQDGIRWKLQAPRAIPGIAGQIEVPVQVDHRGQTFLFYSHTQFENGQPVRALRAAEKTETGYKDLGIICGDPVYALHVVDDPKHPGELLAFAFFEEGPHAMQPTKMVRVEFNDGKPWVRFDGPAQILETPALYLNPDEESI